MPFAAVNAPVDGRLRGIALRAAIGCDILLNHQNMDFEGSKSSRFDALLGRRCWLGWCLAVGFAAPLASAAERAAPRVLATTTVVAVSAVLAGCTFWIQRLMLLQSFGWKFTDED
ncbi:hypothetical protein EBR56_04005, partial [bacterium]|nr:hypothetical protein [bacterium]